MSNNSDSKSGSLHSELYLSRSRDYWWNPDFIGLLGQRFRLDEVHSVLDVGCGQAHWGSLLLPYCARDCQYFGLDSEPAWLEKAEERIVREVPKVTRNQIDLSTGKVESLPFHANRFDVVTCQTLLIHVSNPRVAVEEMKRVTKPGGLILCVEPDNLRSALPSSVVLEQLEVGEVLKIQEYHLRAHNGRIALGLGDHSVGDKLPGLFSDLDLVSIDVFMSDRAFATIPPYDEDSFVFEAYKEEKKWYESGTGPWDATESRRLFLAGGGTNDGFSNCWTALKRAYEIEQQTLRADEFVSSGGMVTYIVGGRKRQ